MIKPFKTGCLKVKDGNEIYWETSGNPKGKPALYLHGGPGSGSMPGYRDLFDPDRFLIVSFDQRGCGRSRPLAIEPEAHLSENNTAALISDIEELRIHLQIDSWLLTGVSWGTTLAIAYAQTHLNRISEMVLAAVTTTSAFEVKWITETMGHIFPREWERFRNAIDLKSDQSLIDAYYEHITHPVKEIREATAKAWCEWEDVHVSMDPKKQPSERFKDPKFCLLFATLVIHYWKHAAFIKDNEITSKMNRISHIPAVLIHGGLDVSSPLGIAWELHKLWEASDLIIVDNEGHGGITMKGEISQAIERFTEERERVRK